MRTYAPRRPIHVGGSRRFGSRAGEKLSPIQPGRTPIATVFLKLNFLPRPTGVTVADVRVTPYRNDAARLARAVSALAKAPRRVFCVGARSSRRRNTSPCRACGRLRSNVAFTARTESIRRRRHRVFNAVRGVVRFFGGTTTRVRARIHSASLAAIFRETNNNSADRS